MRNNVSLQWIECGRHNSYWPFANTCEEFCPHWKEELAEFVSFITNHRTGDRICHVSILIHNRVPYLTNKKPIHSMHFGSPSDCWNQRTLISTIEVHIWWEKALNVFCLSIAVHTTSGFKHNAWQLLVCAKLKTTVNLSTYRAFQRLIGLNKGQHTIFDYWLPYSLYELLHKNACR